MDMNKKYVFSSVAVILMFGVIIYLQLRKPRQEVFWTPEKQREYANKLKAEGLDKEAVIEYEKYLGMQDVDRKTQANIYYTLGKTEEDRGEYEKALAFFYKVELIYPETDIKQELGEHIVSCLEKMGRGLDAQYSLERRAVLEPKEQKEGKEGTVLARIGEEKITSVELNKGLEKLPELMQEEYKKPEKRNEFLKQYIAMELLFRKAGRLGYDKDPELRQKVEDIKREIMVQELLKKEMADKIKITDDQVELYYKANKEKYIDKAKVRMAYLSAENENALKNLKEEYKEIKEWVEKGETYIPDIGESRELVELAFKTELQKTAGPVKVGDKFYIIKVLDKKADREPSFSEIKDMVSSDYQSERQKIVFQELLEETLKAEDVEIYENAEKK